MILVTGGTGLVGNHLLKALLAANKSVKALYRTQHDSFLLTPAEQQAIEWIPADILDVIELEAAMQNVTQVYHCAAMVSFNPHQLRQLFHINVEGTANVVNAALNAGVHKLIYVSSVAAIGRSLNGEPINESMEWTEETNNSNYGKSKYFAELEVWRGISEGLPAAIVNPAIILGAGDWQKSSAGLFKNAYDEFPWYTEGINGFVDVRDVANAMIMLMNSNISAERFILSGHQCTWHQIFSNIARQFGKRPPHKKVTPLLAEIVWRIEKIKGIASGKSPLLTKETARTAQSIFQYDNSKVLRLLPQFQFTPLEQTIADACTTLQQHYTG